MTREEIATGLKNALSRGQSLESAMNSMILAGYNSREIQEAAGNLNLGYSAFQSKPQPVIQNSAPAIVKPIAPPLSQQKTNSPSEYQLPELPPPTQQYYVQKNAEEQYMPKKSRFKGKLIVLIILLVVLIGGLVAFMLFGNEILDFFFK